MDLQNDTVEIKISRRLVRIARLRAEYYESLKSPMEFIDRLAQSADMPDVFSFLQPVPDTKPNFSYRMEWDSLAVLRISTYDEWWKGQINDKTRNMIRRAQKTGLIIRTTEYNDQFVQGIKRIYDESPIIQDKPNRHYCRDFDTIKLIHGTFLEKSDFIGAYEGRDLVGFIKLVHCEGYSGIMHILSMVSSRNKAPTNALIAYAVEICAKRKVPLLMYGAWSRRGLGDFKKHHAFLKYDLPRYYVPFTKRGSLFLRLGLHHRFVDHLPESWLGHAAGLRKKWNGYRYGRKASQKNVNTA